MLRNKRGVAIAALLALSMVFGALPILAAELPQLNPPTGLAWSDDTNGDIMFNAVLNSDGKYKVIISKDGDDSFFNTTWRGGQRDTISIGIHAYIFDSGSYVAKVAAVGVEGFSADSEYAVSAPYQYVKPEAVLATPVNLSWVPNEGLIAIWDLVPYAASYFFEFSVDGMFKGSTYGFGAIGFYDILRFSQQGAIIAGDYTFRVRALSGNIEEYANGAFSEVSSKKNTDQEITNEIKDALDGIIYDPNGSDGDIADAILDGLKDMNTDALAFAILSNNPGVIDRLEELEEVYKEKTGISVLKEVAPGLDLGDTDKIQVLGASFNSENNSDVTLNFVGGEPREDFDENAYRHALHVKIDLVLDDTGEPRTGDLDVPIQITMPVPPGFSPSRLHILHYLANGTIETIWPRRNDDGTISFTLTSFSLFAFVEKANTASNNIDDLDYMDGNGASTAPGGAKASVTAGGGSVSLAYTQTGAGVALSLTDSEVAALIAAASGGAVVIDMNSLSGATGATAPAVALAKIANAGIALQLAMPAGTIRLDSSTLRSALAQASAGGTLDFSVAKLGVADLAPAQKGAVKDGDVIVSASVSSGSQKITNFGGEIALTIPYEGPLPAAVWYLNDVGELTKMGCSYDAAAKTVTFVANHLSVFVIGKDDAVGLTIKLVVGALGYNVKGVAKTMDTTPYILDGRAMVPLRFIAEALGAKVVWDDDTRTVTVELEDKELSLTIDVLSEGMDVPPMIVDGRTMVPLRYVDEALGCGVVWNPDASTIDITKQAAS